MKTFVFIRDCDNCFRPYRLIGKNITTFYETNDKMEISVPCKTKLNRIVNFIKVQAAWNNNTRFDWCIKPGSVISDGELLVVTYGALKASCKRAFIKLTNPITCNESMKIDWYDIDEKTGKNRNFNVSLNLSNHLDHPIRVNVLVDVTDRPIFNSFLPNFMKMDTSIYNVGHCMIEIGKNGYINRTINCSFPKNWYCQGEFVVTVECEPYIYINDTSSLVDTFYEQRFKDYILPKYDVDDDVVESIRTMWSNTPFFLYNKETLFPVARGTIEFGGPSFTEETIEIVEDKVNSSVENFKEFIIIIIIGIIIFLVGFAVFRSVLDWIVRKHS